MAFFNCFIHSAGLEDGGVLFEMLEGVPLGLYLSTSFEKLHLRNIEQNFGNIDWCVFVHDDNIAPCMTSCQVDEAIENDSLTDMLYYREAMQEDDVHLPLGPAHSTLVLSAWLRERAGTLTDTDWTRLCEVGVTAAVKDGGEERECVMEEFEILKEFEMALLELSAQHDGFVW